MCPSYGTSEVSDKPYLHIVITLVKTLVENLRKCVGKVAQTYKKPVFNRALKGLAFLKREGRIISDGPSELESSLPIETYRGYVD